MSIKNHLNPHIQLNPNFNQIRKITTFLVIAFFAFQNVYEYFTGIGWFYAYLTSLSMFMLPTYINQFILIPRLLVKNKLSFYIVALFLVIIIGLLMYAPAVQYLYQKYGVVTEIFVNENAYSFPNVLYAIVIIGMITMGTTSIELFRRWMIYDRQITELEKTSMQSELQQLKNQINPHFLFNMLNNANILVKEDPDEASRLLTKLDDMLRYQLNDSARQEVFLSADIHFLTGFLELEKIRRDHFQFTMEQEGDIDSIWIQPLLFIPFVENAVKHSFDSEHPSYVHVSFKVDNDRLEFRCENSTPEVAVSKGKVGGIGLVNIQRRLGLLYPGRYELKQIENENKYTVILSITL